MRPVTDGGLDVTYSVTAWSGLLDVRLDGARKCPSHDTFNIQWSKIQLRIVQYPIVQDPIHVSPNVGVAKFHFVTLNPIH